MKKIDWKLAVCRGKDPDIWSEDSTQDIAVAWCLGCPIKWECLDHALNMPERFGVWGGKTADERKIIGYRKSRARCPSCRSIEVDQTVAHVEVCRSCGLSWKV